MTTVLSVLRSGGIYDAEWVAKLQRGVERWAPECRFICLSDVEVPCERIKLREDWPGWWAKIEMFRKGVISGPTLYLDLDTIVTGPLDKFIEREEDFAMLASFHEDGVVGSGLMWFKEKAPNAVYERFAADPNRIMNYYEMAKDGPYRGDQAFIHDVMDRDVPVIRDDALRSYKMHCRGGLPEGTSIVCFHGHPRPIEVNAKWLKDAWV